MSQEPKNRRTEEPKNLILFLWFFGFCILCAPGCHVSRWLRRDSGSPPPVAFAALPSPMEAVSAVNANTQRVQTLQTQGATISIPGAPSIGAEVALARPRQLRIKAGTQLLGPELDLGSNDQLLWLWAARMPDPSVYFARHDQFAGSRARQMLAIEPAWLIQAIGLVEIEPGSVIDGPHTAGSDRVQLRTTMPSAGGAYTRQLVLHGKYAWVLEQQVFDERGQLIASAKNSGHEYFPLDGVSLPKKTDVQLPQGGLRLVLDVDRWAINQPLPDAQTLFELPRAQLGNYPFVDMADPNFVPPGGGVTPSASPLRTTQQTKPRVRGLTTRR